MSDASPGFCQKRKQSVRRPTEVTPGSTQRKGKTPFLLSVSTPGLRTQQWVGSRSAATPTAASTPLRARGPLLLNNGRENTATGAGALLSNTTGPFNTANGAFGTTAQVIVSADGQLGTVSSSERFKKDITSMDRASEAILSFRPVTFRYKSDTKRMP